MFLSVDESAILEEGLTEINVEHLHGIEGEGRSKWYAFESFFFTFDLGMSLMKLVNPWLG